MSLTAVLFLAGCQFSDSEKKAELVPVDEAAPAESGLEEVVVSPDSAESTEETTSVLSKRLPPIQLDGPVSFDGCGKPEKYKDYDWYDDFSRQVENFYAIDYGYAQEKYESDLEYYEKYINKLSANYGIKREVIENKFESSSSADVFSQEMTNLIGVDAFPSRPFYDFKTNLLNSSPSLIQEKHGKMSISDIGEICYSEDSDLAIALYEGALCSEGYIFRYDLKNHIIERATLLSDDARMCLARYVEFGKRQGEIIPVKAEFGDAGNDHKSEFLYNYQKNTIRLKRTCNTSENNFGEAVETCKEYPTQIEIAGPVSFDGCGKPGKYKDYDWYDDFDRQIKALNLNPLIASSDDLKEICFSGEGNLAIVLYGGDYCEKGSVFRYDTENGILEKAELVGEIGNCSANFYEFGKRSGSIVPIKAASADGGCKRRSDFDYDFVNNAVSLVKDCLGCYKILDESEVFEEECEDY